jgi:antitoxin MazE
MTGTPLLVVLGACVLANFSLCDTLLRLAEPPRLFEPKWSEEIIQETGLTHRASRNNIVITMKVMHVSIRRIGNSQGVVIPKPVLTQLGLSGEAGAEMTIEGDALVLRRPASPVRTGWAEAARKIAEAGDDELVMGEFGNAADTELAW